jgi:hypothetical protein
MITTYKVKACIPAPNGAEIVLCLEDIFGRRTAISLDKEYLRKDEPLLPDDNILVATNKVEGYLIVTGVRKFWIDPKADPRENRRSELIYGREFLRTQ